MTLGGWRRRYEELDAELASHIDMAVRDRIARGETAESARAAARREFGNLTHVGEVTRDLWKWTWLERLSRAAGDVRYTLRRLSNARAFTATAVASLALGIAATTTMFTVVDAVDFRPLPFPNAERLVTLREVAPAGSRECTPVYGCVTSRSSRPMVADWREQSRTLESIAAYRLDMEFRWNHGDETEPFRATDVSANLFPALGVRPLLGRTFLPSEVAPGGDAAIILSYDLLINRFAGDPKVVGTRLSITSLNYGNTTSPVVVGVMPKGFRILTETAWLPMRTKTGALDRQEKGTVFAIGLLARGHRIEEAQAEARAIAARIAAAFPATDAGWSAEVEPLTAVALLRIPTIDSRNAGRGRFMLLGIVSLVLLVATVNVALLFLVRGRSRKHELTIRKAIGASRASLARLLLSESLAITIAGGALGVLLALWGVRLASEALGLSSYGIPIGVDLRALLFTMAVAAGAALLASLPPVLQLTSFDAGDALREHSGGGGGGSGRRTWAQGALIAGEIAAVLALLTGAGLLGKELRRLRRDEPGYDPAGLYWLTAVLPNEVMRNNPRHHVIAERAEADVDRIPGIERSAILAPSFVALHVDGQVDSTLQSLSTLAIGPGFFTTVGTPVLQGRAIDNTDVAGAPAVVMVNEIAAARLWPGENAIGKTITLRSSDDSTAPLKLAQVVGVAARSKLWVTPLTSAAEPLVYLSFDQDQTSARRELIILARAGSATAKTVTAMRAALHQATNGPVDVTDVVSQEESISTELRQHRFDAIALTAFAVFGLLLAAIGIYGVVAFTVTQRTREIGVRMALGANRRDVLRLVSRETLVLVVVGVVAGLGASFAFTRILRAMLIRTSATDPATFIACALVMSLIAIIATLLPAMRATKVSPVVALRGS